MKRLLLLVFLLLPGDSFRSESWHKRDTVPSKTNIAIIVDVGSRYHSYTHSLLLNILNGISLAAYRISFYSTSGLSVGIQEFQSRQCLIKNFKKYKERSKKVGDLFHLAYTDMCKSFGEDSGNLLVIFDRKISNMSKIQQFKERNNNKVYFIDVRQNPIIYNDNQSFSKVLNKVPFVDGDLMSCKGKNHVDECKRLCECKDGKQLNCYRIRKEFSSMKFTERMRFISSYMELGSNGKYKAAFLKYIYIHADNFYLIHNATIFLPWHRKYILGFENLIRLVDCRVTLPFWNWALYSDVIWSITPSYHMWNNKGGFGGDGNRNKAYCVDSGYFGYRRWETHETTYSKNITTVMVCSIRFTCTEDDDQCLDEYSRRFKVVTQKERKCYDIFYSNPHYQTCLKRRFSYHPPNYHTVFRTIYDKADDISKIHNAIHMWHDMIHQEVGGHMETLYSSKSPEFWLHHSVLDAFWDRWQKRGKEFEYSTFPDNMTLLPGFGRKENASLYFHNNNLSPCGVKVLYYNVFPFKPDKNYENHHEYNDNGENKKHEDYEDDDWPLKNYWL